MTDDKITISPGPNFMAAMILALAADALQLVVFPMFVEGAASPADDVLDLGVGAMMVHLILCQTHPRRRPGSVVDTRCSERLPQGQADGRSIDRRHLDP
jgi:hypothetical protein